MLDLGDEGISLELEVDQLWDALQDLQHALLLQLVSAQVEVGEGLAILEVLDAGLGFKPILRNVERLEAGQEPMPLPTHRQ